MTQSKQEQNATNEMTLIQKLARIRAMSGVVTKSKDGYKYKYADITEILANITSGMAKHRVSLIPQINADTTRVTQNVQHNAKVDKQGHPYESVTTEMLVQADMVFKWVNDDNPGDFIAVPWTLIGSQADPSQAFGSALTYCTRYFLTNYFQIAQPENDVDGYRKKQKYAEEFEDREIAKEIIGKFDSMLKSYLANNPDKTAELKEFIRTYEKNSNYFAIKSPELAAKLLESFQRKYLTPDKLSVNEKEKK